VLIASVAVMAVDRFIRLPSTHSGSSSSLLKNPLATEGA
jgi:hypothetical protein